MTGIELSDRVTDALVAALGAEAVRIGEAVPARNCADESGLAPTRPRAVLLPRNTDEVSAALRICHEHGQPVVTQGGLTGLAGGAHPHAAEIALSLERMSGVEEVDALAGTLTALAGTPLHAVQAAAEEAGWLCGIDLGARGSCTIGGNVATNAGGNQVLRYGMTRRNVLGLEVVTADGTVIRSLNKMLKNNAGYDWTQIYVGSEGTLGVVTRVVLGLHPRPEAVQTALVAVADFTQALAVLRSLERRFGGGLMCFEAMWREFMEAAVARMGLGQPFADEHEILVLVEVAPGAAGPDGFAEALAELMEAGTVADAVIAQSGQDRARLWAYRESPYEYHRVMQRLVTFDISIPRGRIEAAVAGLRRAAADWPGALLAVFGHVADSNLHVIVAPEGPHPTKDAVEAAVYGLVAEHAGSVSAEHGIGRNKRGWLKLSRTEPEIALMRTLKTALDPADILNRGRIL